MVANGEMLFSSHLFYWLFDGILNKEAFGGYIFWLLVLSAYQIRSICFCLIYIFCLSIHLIQQIDRLPVYSKSFVLMGFLYFKFLSCEEVVSKITQDTRGLLLFVFLCFIRNLVLPSFFF